MFDLSRLYAYGIGAVLLSGALWWAIDAIGDRREQKVIDQIEEENDEVINDADIAQLGFDECINAGGVWDFASAECGRPETGDR